MSEDVTVEHLLTLIDAESDVVWNACANFCQHLYWYQPRYTVLGPIIEELPDDHRSKPLGFFRLSQLSRSVGNYAEQKRFLMHNLNPEREWGGGVIPVLPAY